MFILKMSVSNNTALRNQGVPELLAPAAAHGQRDLTIRGLKYWRGKTEANAAELTSTARWFAESAAAGGLFGTLASPTNNLPASRVSQILLGFGTVFTVVTYLLEPNLELNKTPDSQPSSNAEDPAAKPAETPPIDTSPEPPPAEPLKKPKPKKTPTPIPAPGGSPEENLLFEECIKEVTSLKNTIANSALEECEERANLIKLLNVVRAMRGKNVGKFLDIRTGENIGLRPNNLLTLRKYTLELLKDIIVDSKNDQTIDKSLETVFNLFMKPTRDKLKADTGTVLLALINKRPDTLERLNRINLNINPAITITSDLITDRLKKE